MLHRTRMHWLCRPRQLCSNTPTDSLLSSHLPSLSLTDWLTFNSHTRINTQYTHTHTHKKKYERKQKGRRRDSDLLTEGRIEKIIIMRFRYCVTSPQLNYAMFNRYTSQFTSSNHYWYVGGGGQGGGVEASKWAFARDLCGGKWCRWPPNQKTNISRLRRSKQLLILIKDFTASIFV